MKRKTISVFVIAVALVCLARPALAVDPVFSNDPADYGAELDYDSTANTVGLVIDVQLAQGITLDAMSTFLTTYTTCPNPWLAAIWDDIKDDKVAMVGFLLGSMATAKPAELSCVLLTAATTGKGDKIRCTQVTKADLGPSGLDMTLDEFEAWLEYYYIFLMDGMDITFYKVFSIPLNVSSLVAKGVAAPVVEEEEVVVVLEEECDTSIDPDCDGVIGDADLCHDEWGDGEDGCPIAAPTLGDEGGPISDGGGCSLIRP